MDMTNQSLAVPAIPGKPPPSTEPAQRPRKKPYDRNKQPRFNRPSDKNPYLQKTIPATLATSVIKYFHPIHTSTAGIDTFSKLIYEIYSARDQRLEKAFTPGLLSYISTLALTYRIYNTAITLGYNLRKPSFYSDLNEIAPALSLPEPIAKYVESVGSFLIASGICLVPHAPSAAELAAHVDFLYMEDLIEEETGSASSVSEERREVPPHRSPDRSARGNRRRARVSRPTQPPPAREKVFIDIDLVGTYMKQAAAGLKFGTLFRKVDYTKTEGNASFISAFTELGRHRLNGYSPMAIEQTLCQLGACYRFRHMDERTQWLGSNDDYRCVQETGSFIEISFITDKVVGHMTPR